MVSLSLDFPFIKYMLINAYATSKYYIGLYRRNNYNFCAGESPYWVTGHTDLRLSLKASTPYLVMQYAPPIVLILPNTLATLTTLPLAFLMSGNTLRVTATTPIRLTLIIDLKSSISSQSLGAVGKEIPALLTTAHRPANTHNSIKPSCFNTGDYQTHRKCEVRTMWRNYSTNSFSQEKDTKAQYWEFNYSNNKSIINSSIYFY